SPCYNESIPDSAATSFSEGMTNSGADAANLGKPSYPCFHLIGRILGGFGVCIELGSWLSRYSECCSRLRCSHRTVRPRHQPRGPFRLSTRWAERPSASRGLGFS